MDTQTLESPGDVTESNTAAVLATGDTKRHRRIVLGAVTATGHLLQRAGERLITPEDIESALGVDPLNAPVAPADGTLNIDQSTLWRIGEQAGRAKRSSPDHKTVLLGFTDTGRPLHLVLVQPWDPASTKASRPELVTLWDPSADENRTNWQDDFAGPTKSGQYKVPRTNWYRPPSK